MDFLKTLPRNIVVALVLVGGLILIIVANPPHTLCDAEISSYESSQASWLFPRTEKGITSAPRMLTLEKTCKETNSSGGCYEWFQGMHRAVTGMMQISNECSGELMEKDTLKGTVDRSISLIARLAWGDKAPASSYERKGWLEEPDIALFCKLIDVKSKSGGKEEWETLRAAIMQKLPGADQLGFNETWKRSLFSTDCRIYL